MDIQIRAMILDEACRSIMETYREGLEIASPDERKVLARELNKVLEGIRSSYLEEWSMMHMYTKG